jgi:hypothetical protein
MNDLFSVMQKRKLFFQCKPQIEKEVLQILSTVNQFETIEQKIKKIRYCCFYEFDDDELTQIDKSLEEIMDKDIKHTCHMMDLSKIIGTAYYDHCYPQTPSNSHKHLSRLVSSDLEWITNELLHFERLMNVHSENFYYQSILKIPAEKYWCDYLAKERECFGDCDHCNKQMYPHRTGYLKSWLNVYIKNEEQIKCGKIIPKLWWHATMSAKEFTLGDFHRERCDSQVSVKKCQCDIACLLRAMYFACDKLIVKSLDQIIPLYSKMKKQRKTSSIIHSNKI